MSDRAIEYFCYPRTKTPPRFADSLVAVFEDHAEEISTRKRDDGLKSDEVLQVLRGDLESKGFEVETGNKKADKIHRPVLFGRNGQPQLRYEVDAYQEGWRCGLEVEAGRAWKGNAIYRDLIQGLMMVQVETLAIAVPIEYKYSRGTNPAFRKTNDVIETLFRTDRFDPPYDLILIGY